MSKRITFLSTFFLLLMTVSGCNNNDSSTSSTKQPDEVTDTYTSGTISVDEPVLSDEEALLELNHIILSHFKQGSYEAVANYIHPQQGVRFSPYRYVDTIRDQQFSLERFKAEINSNKKINWGAYDGSGDKILLTCKEYFSKFVYDHDFANAEKTSLSKTLGNGNSLNNLTLIYPNVPYVENYFSGFDKKYGGMDWSSLRLVFEKKGDRYYLVGVVHDQWTI